MVYSFQAVKNLPTADSGMICFKDGKLDEIVRKKTWLGIDKDTYARTQNMGNYKWKYDVEYVGEKGHGNSVMAAIGLVQLMQSLLLQLEEMKKILYICRNWMLVWLNKRSG